MKPTTVFLRSKWFWLCALVTFIIIALSVALQKPSIEALNLEQRNSDWKVANFRHKRVSETELMQLNVAALWGIEEVEQAVTINNSWALKGIIEDNGIRIAIIDLDIKSTNNQGDRFGRFKEGDTLPNGATLTSITKHHIEYELNGTTELRRLYAEF